MEEFFDDETLAAITFDESDEAYDEAISLEMEAEGIAREKWRVEQGIEPFEPPVAAVPAKRGRPKGVRKEGTDYISNADLTAAITEWVNQIPLVEIKGKTIKDVKNRTNWPIMSNYLGQCFEKLVDNYGNKTNFRNYSYLDEMKAEAKLSCIKYAHNFDPNKSSNAFAYFTQVIHNAFLQILNKEKLQNDIKMKSISEDSPYNYNLINLYDGEQDTE